VIDAHVHLAFAGNPVEAMLRAGVAAVLDLGMPERDLPGPPSALRVVFSGPLLTSPGGYPTQTWGRDGYGCELRTPLEARAAVERLYARGARFAKLALPSLDVSVAQAAAARAHELGMLVAAHALDDTAAAAALTAGADVLAHTPRSGGEGARWVISTLHAFGVPAGRLRALREAGVRVAYGTDLGNEDTAPGVDARELSLLRDAGLSPLEVLKACTSDAAELLGLGDLGRLAVGSAASLLALREDPLQDVTALSRPAWVMIDGHQLS
jgi:imidazolonepropionase-like amidohydrolase